MSLPTVEETVSVMKLAHVNTHKQVPNAQPQFANKVVDDRVKVQRQVAQSKWR